ncbi:MAG TPA: nitroreductase family protein [Streptosporangiaceae bacterium]
MVTHPLATHTGVGLMVAAASTAPSVHNTQPWRFRRRDRDAMELHVDMNRLLYVIDPRGRAMHISCGAALFNLCLAIRASGHQPWVRRLPDSDDQPTLLADVHIERAAPPTQAEAELYSVLPRRRTNRGPFDDRAVPRRVLAELAAAANYEGATLRLLDPVAAAHAVSLVAAADDELTASEDYRAELADWTFTRTSDTDASSEARPDGVPWYTFGPRPSRRGLPIRDFGLAHHVAGRAVNDFTAMPHLAALITEGNEPEDWLVAGQALQRVLLTATLHGVSASFLTQPLDLRDVRENRDIAGVRHRPGPLDHVQMIIRFGYGRPAPGAPRRPIAQILDRTA